MDVLCHPGSLPNAQCCRFCNEIFQSSIYLGWENLFQANKGILTQRKDAFSTAAEGTEKKTHQLLFNTEAVGLADLPSAFSRLSFFTMGPVLHSLLHSSLFPSKDCREGMEFCCFQVSLKPLCSGWLLPWSLFQLWALLYLQSQIWVR